MIYSNKDLSKKVLPSDSESATSLLEEQLKRQKKIIVDYIESIAEIKSQVLAWIGFNEHVLGIDDKGDEWNMQIPKESIDKLKSIIEGKIEYPRGIKGVVIGQKVFIERDS